MVFSQIHKSCRSSLIKNYKGWQKSSQKAYFKDIKLPIKIRDIHKDEKKSIGISIFGYENKEKYFMYQKIVSKKNMLTYY